MLPNLGYDRSDGRIHHTKQSKDEQVGHDDEEKVSGGDCSVETRSSGCALIFGDFADDNREEVTEKNGNNGREHTGNDGELANQLMNVTHLELEKLTVQLPH